MEMSRSWRGRIAIVLLVTGESVASRLGFRTIAGNGTSSIVDGMGTNARFGEVLSMIEVNGGYFLGDLSYVRYMNGTTLEVTTIAGGDTQDYADGDGLNARFRVVYGMVTYLIITDYHDFRIRRMTTTPPYTVTTLAGTGQDAHLDGVGTYAKVSYPGYVAMAPNEQFVVMSQPYYNNIRIIDITTDPVTLTTLAGDANGNYGFVDATGTNARFDMPYGVAIFADMSAVLIGDYYNHVIRHVTIPDGVVTTWCGTGERVIKDEHCDNAGLKFMEVVVFTPDYSEIYIVNNERTIRKINRTTKQVSYVGGDDSRGYVDGPASAARFYSVYELVFSSITNTLIFPDVYNFVIREMYVMPSDAPTTTPSSAPSATPTTSFPTFIPTSSTPTVAPSSIPTMLPSSYPTAAPTSSAPTLNPTPAIAEHIYVHAVDIHGDGWGDDLVIAVMHHNNGAEFHSLKCACKVIRLPSASGDMTIYMYRNTSEPGLRTEHVPYEWEALWTIGFSDGISVNPLSIYGGVNTEVVIENWNVISLSRALDIHADAPKNRCVPPPPPPKSTPGSAVTDDEESTNSTTTSSSGLDGSMPPVANVRLALVESEGSAWCDDSGNNHVFVCSKENVNSPDANLPNILTYPRYFISDAEGRMLLEVGTMRVGTFEDVREVKLPREGSFVFSLSGHYLSEVGMLLWDFCGEQGGIGERLHFDMIQGVCKSHYIEKLDGELTCDGEWSTSALHTTSMKALSPSSQLTEMRFGIQISMLVAAVTAMVAIVLMLFTKGRTSRSNLRSAMKAKNFTVIDVDEEI